MKINSVTALQEEVQGNFYVIRLPHEEPLAPPFIVTTDDNELVYEVAEFNKPISKSIDLQSGECTLVYGKPSKVEVENATLKEQADADKEYIGLLEARNAR